MKLTKSLFMLCAAGLSLCACNSDDKLQMPEGAGMVEVKVVDPQTRAIASEGSDGSTIDIDGDITITLYATFVDANGNEVTTTKTATISRSELDGEGKGVAKFWNVKTPTLVTASVNTGKQDYTTTSITTLEEVLPANIPAYGEIVPSLTTNTASPDLVGDDDNVNANSGDNTKKYQVYTAAIQMEIPVARLEVSGIKLAASTKYTSLTLTGVYLDNVRENGSKWDNGFGTYAAAPKDYAFATDKGTGEIAILSDEVATVLTGATLPASPQVYAYNFYAAPTDYTGNDMSYNPSFKLYFATGASSETVSFPRFAFIRNYYADDAKTQPIVLKNGHVYKITSATLTDQNIIGDESGNTLYGVDVTVTEAVWSVVPTYADWAD
jgi:hypothetical protein